MNAAREVSGMTEEQCIEALATTAQLGSIMATGVAARLQQLQLARLSGNTAEMTAQTAKLLAVAEQQRLLAAKLDGQTDTLIGVTRRLGQLTVWLIILTVALCAFETRRLFEPRRDMKSDFVGAPPAAAALPPALMRSAEEGSSPAARALVILSNLQDYAKLSAKDASSSSARANSRLEPTRFEIVQSPLAAKWTFRLDRFAGEVCQLVETADKHLTWEEMKVLDLPSVDPLQKRVRFQIFTSPLAARHTYLIDLMSGKAWRVTVLLDENNKETETVWQPFLGE